MLSPSDEGGRPDSELDGVNQLLEENARILETLAALAAGKFRAFLVYCKR
jgi:hypothetical protein